MQNFGPESVEKVTHNNFLSKHYFFVQTKEVYKEFTVIISKVLISCLHSPVKKNYFFLQKRDKRVFQ